ncbi:hypothetical protein Dimus_038221 [Dionaea muscipula]
MAGEQAEASEEVIAVEGDVESDVGGVDYGEHFRDVGDEGDVTVEGDGRRGRRRGGQERAGRGGAGGRRGRGRGRGQGREEDEASALAPAPMIPLTAEQLAAILPADRSLLGELPTHVAMYIWHGRERELLRVLNHAWMVEDWSVDVTDQTRTRWRALVEGLVLAPLFRQRQDETIMLYRFSCRVLVSTFIERWFLETNTFHFWFGEMTITLEDVHQLLGLSVTGRPVHFDGMTDRATVTQLMVDLLGVSPVDLAVAMEGSLVKLEWLRSHFELLGTDDAADEKIERAARPYLLYILDTTIFTSKSGDKVSTSYLHLLRDLTCLDGFAWCAACLAFLYRELGKVSRVGTCQMAGYLTLLEARVPEHFTIFRGTYDRTCLAAPSLAFRWVPRRHPGQDITHIRDILNHYPLTEVFENLKSIGFPYCFDV